MEVNALFGEVGLERFVEEHLHRLPLALPGTAAEACRLGTWESLGELLAGAEVDAMVVRDGQRYAGEPPRDVAAARRLSDEGYTILVRHAERQLAEIAELARAFERAFLAPVDVHLYATPPGRHGFSWHYDAEDVFILQTTGAKEYSLRKNTVNPWPLEETLPADMQYEREQMPLARVLLGRGDLLYIPCGYWHKAEAHDAGEAAISLAVGVMSRAAIDVVDFLRGELAESLLWRQRLPVGARLDAQALAAILAPLGADLAKRLGDPRLAERVAAWLRGAAE
jgi:ribosomal protein L16 Arg81 hydroxylase